ncbi:lipopolysaccharide biosynthesis protein [Clostridium perfringens]|uniref:lipopolysaccharide biosynthesis protein n=1 Tax=Clostridium perfringens TaxID=1502 RepID=UPI0023F94AC2|nr:oligosaccharide flippase family protein [Clostridium perfringens]WEV22676.1 oligosaccharide flippase family protein [Clostridium perfringens D]
MKKILKNIFKNKFNRNVIMITGGTAISQIITIIISPLITRLYLPTDYGVLTVYSSILGMISLIGALSYDSAIPIAEDDDKAINILVLSISIIIFSTFLICFILSLYGEDILKLLDSSIVLKYKYYIPIGLFITGIYNVLTNWALRKKDFKAITKTKLSQSIFGNFTKILWGIISYGPVGLILGTVIGQGAGITTLIKSIFKFDKNIFKSVRLRELLWCIRRYKNFPIYSAPTIFLLSFSSQIPVIFMSSLYGAARAGFYGLALNITFLPMTFIGKSVQDVFYGEVANMGKERASEIKELSNKLLKKLLLLGIIPMIILFLFGPKLFSIIFGSEWKEAGIYSSLLVPFAFSYFIFHPISVVFSIFERQKNFFVLNIIKLIAVLITFFISKILGLSSYTTILIFSIFMSIIEAFKYIFAQKIMEDKRNN